MQQARDKKVIKVLLLILVLNLIVSGAKIIYGWITHSLSLEADGYHSLIDATSNVVGIIGIVLASKPPDAGHPYGHRKIEALTSLGISFLLFLTCYEIINHTINRVQHGMMPQVTVISFVVVGVTLIINFFVARYENKQAQLLKSDILLADSLHTRSDIYVSLAVLVSFGAVLFKAPLLDVIIAIGIVMMIFVMAFKVLLRSLNTLLDAQLLQPDLIENIVNSVPGIVQCHNVRTRGTHSSIFVDLHIRVDPTLSTGASHELTHEAINAVKKEFPQVIEVLIHTEPIEE